MSQTTPSSSLAQLEADMNRALAGAKAGAILIIVLSLVSLVLVGYYLSYAHDEFTVKYGTPKFVADQVVARVTTELPAAQPQIRDQLIAKAPEYIGMAENELYKMPDTFAKTVLAQTEAELKKMMPQVEAELTKSLKTALADAVAKRGKNVKDEEYAKTLVDALGDRYEKDSIKLIDEVRTKYTKDGGDIVAYLNFLAENKGLDRKEALQRQALVTFLTIASRAKTAGT